ncbi:hypothetical protein ANO14919_007290 [Xylariales sp. No.14919]|nr:hypothetical protein ANO14919_007290 [Xylariales sp. No.14919]
MPTPFILLLVQASTALAAATERTCYHITGEPTRHSPGRPKFIPCDPDAAVSNCCSESDLCMGNGVCLGLDAFNAFTFQGCTHPDWPEACSHGFRWPDTISAGFYAHVWQCRYGYSTPYCTGQNASCCEDESGWVYLPRFSNIHLAGSTDYVIRDNSVNSGVGGDLGASDRIALGVGISLPFVAILVAVGQWLFPGARLWFWKKRKGSMKLKMDDEGGLLEEGRENVFSDRSSGLEMPAAGDLGERQPSRYRDEIGVPGFDRALDTKTG